MLVDGGRLNVPEVLSWIQGSEDLILVSYQLPVAAHGGLCGQPQKYHPTLLLTHGHTGRCLR